MLPQNLLLIFSFYVWLPPAAAKCPFFVKELWEKEKTNPLIECALISVAHGDSYLVLYRNYAKKEGLKSGITLEFHRHPETYDRSKTPEFVLTQLGGLPSRMKIGNLFSWIYTYDFEGDGSQEFVLQARVSPHRARRYLFSYNLRERRLESKSAAHFENRRTMEYLPSHAMAVSSETVGYRNRNPLKLHYQLTPYRAPAGQGKVWKPPSAKKYQKLSSIRKD